MTKLVNVETGEIVPAEERVTQSRSAQGLPDRVEDVATLARVAQLLQQTNQENTR